MRPRSPLAPWSMLWLWLLLAVLAGAAGVRILHRTRVASRPPRVDDDAVRRILETGSLPADEDEPLDLDAAARAEAEFWDESWDEPEEHPR